MRTFKRLNEQQKDYIKSSSFETLRETADKIGCHPSTVLRVLRRSGVEARDRWNEKKARVFMRLYNDRKVSSSVIAHLFGIGESSVRYTSVILSKRYQIERLDHRRKTNVLPESDIEEIVNQAKKEIDYE